MPALPDKEATQMGEINDECGIYEGLIISSKLFILLGRFLCNVIMKLFSLRIRLRTFINATDFFHVSRFLRSHHEHFITLRLVAENLQIFVVSPKGSTTVAINF